MVEPAVYVPTSTVTLAPCKYIKCHFYFLI
nr:MAG TPA: hypothetical protein [Caudoviricetes sp.]